MSASLLLLPLLLILRLCSVATVRGKVHRRVGEASNPGPGHNLDDSQADFWPAHGEMDDGDAASGDDAGEEALPPVPTSEVVSDSDAETSVDSDGDLPAHVMASWADAEALAGLSAPRSRGSAPPSVAPPLSFPSQATFAQSRAFQGGRPGFVFATREGYTGYYKDRVIPKATLHLSNLLELWPSSGEPPVTAPASHAYRHDGKRHRPKGRARRAKTCPSDLAAIRTGSTEMADDSFKDCGLWAFDTVNSNAWSTARDRILVRLASDCVMLQETRVFAEDAEQRIRAQARDIGWNAVAAPAARTDAGAGSSGCAVLTRKGTGIAVPPGVAVAPGFRHRLVVSWISAVFKGGIYVCRRTRGTASGWTMPTSLCWRKSQGLLSS